MNRWAQYIATLRPACTIFLLAVIPAGLFACHEPDPRTVRGALAAAARALESRDARAFFPIIDQRARAAMASIVKSRQRAAQLVRTDYPEPERTRALATLGDAQDALDGADLFERRCGRGCLAEFEAAVGAPAGTVPEPPPDEVAIETTTGGRLVLHRGNDQTFGIVWNTPALQEERTRAARELIQIQHNAEVYRKRRALE